jgi:hypothetical protein
VMQRLLYWKLFVPEAMSHHWFWAGGQPYFIYRLRGGTLKNVQPTPTHVSNIKTVMEEQTGHFAPLRRVENEDGFLVMMSIYPSKCDVTKNALLTQYEVQKGR